ncbi:replication protein C (plasmid) [Pseudovibrio brasiliensis]|uniref:Replication protein C n=2 Tax=Pseudovibrio brasiliensis TaxID=1898042 RepID=A0ABX8B013_9HYPH|nr:replication protein C [Pseudovibrio brasiliensis]
MLHSQKLAQADDVVKTTKASVAMALKKAAPALGINGTTYHILDILIGLTRAEDWSVERRPLVAISNEKLAQYVARSTRTVVRSIRKLVEAGILAYHDSPTGRRFIHRGSDGEIERGFGLDFSPARQRVEELFKIGADFAAALAVVKEARRAITSCLRRLADMSALAQQEGLDFSELDQQSKVIANANMDPLQKAEALQMLCEVGLNLLAPDEQCEVSSATEMSGAGDMHGSSYNNTNPQDSEKSNQGPLKATECRRHPKAFEDNSLAHAKCEPIPAAHERSLNNLSISQLASALPETQSALGVSLQSWADLNNICEDLRLLIGLSPSGWQTAVTILGKPFAGAILAVTAEKVMRNSAGISRPAGYFRACVERAHTGELYLHRSIFGLVQSSSKQLN